jgi:tRNA G18 (ribose-2'-O)-methylase SpoU
MSRGFFEIGIINGKSELNVGTLWRSAYQMGASGIFTIGRRYPLQCTDTPKSQLTIPYREYLDFDGFQPTIPRNCVIVAIEMGGRPLKNFVHPERAIYLLGAEDNGISKKVLEHCHSIISIPAVRTSSYNVAVAGSLVMYDRQNKSNAW